MNQTGLVFEASPGQSSSCEPVIQELCIETGTPAVPLELLCSGCDYQRAFVSGARKAPTDRSPPDLCLWELQLLAGVWITSSELSTSFINTDGRTLRFSTMCTHQALVRTYNLGWNWRRYQENNRVNVHTDIVYTISEKETQEMNITNIFVVKQPSQLYSDFLYLFLRQCKETQSLPNYCIQLLSLLFFKKICTA